MTNRPELSFDGRGINGPDIYRTRIATFSQSVTDADCKRYGKLFAAAPVMETALRNLLMASQDWDKLGETSRHNFQNAALAALTAAKEGTP